MVKVTAAEMNGSNKMEESRSSSSSMNDSDDTFMCSTFNQDGGCLAVGTGEGFRICNVSPFQETFRRRHPISSNGGILHMEMLFRCNLLALVCSSFPNKVYIWDDHLGRPIGELSFRQKVLRVKLCRDRICVALRDRIYVYNFGNLKLLDTIVTGENSKGLLCISTDTPTTTTTTTTTSNSNATNWILACPSGVVKGQVRVELYGHRKSNLVQAHDHKLAAMALTADGSMLATASERGTVIRLFDTSQLSPSKPLREFRRGVERANISCLAFSLDKSWLASAGSDRGTVHIFRVSTTTTPKKESSSTLSSGKKWATRLLVGATTTTSSVTTESSHEQIRGIPHPQLCAFVPDKPRTIAVAGLDDNGNGCLLLANFTNEKNKEEPQRIAYHRFFKKDPDDPKKAKHTTTKTKTQQQQQQEESKVYMQDDQGVEEDFTMDLSNQLETIVFDDADGFVNIETTTTTTTDVKQTVMETNSTCNDETDDSQQQQQPQQQASTEIFQDATEKDEDLNQTNIQTIQKNYPITESKVKKDDTDIIPTETVGGIIDEKLKNNLITTPDDKSNLNSSTTKQESAKSPNTTTTATNSTEKLS